MVHANFDDSAYAKKFLARWNDVGRKWVTKETNISGVNVAESNAVRMEFERRGVEIIHFEAGSVGAWLWCREESAVVEVRSMMKDGRLCDLLTRTFLALLKNECYLKVKLEATSDQFKQADNYFLAFCK